MKKLLSIVGARPQFIKAVPISHRIKEEGMEEVMVHTGQHYDLNMSEVFFEQMKIPAPQYTLEMGGLSHGSMTGRMIEELEKIMEKEDADLVIVFGDTNTTLAGAISAGKLNIPLAHVEAGLRSFNRSMPEEFNRVLTDHAADLLLCPTDQAVENLREEICDKRGATIVKTGDVMQDAVLYFKQFQDLPELPFKEFILATVHRSENTDDPERLKSLVRGLNHVHQELPVVLPLHPRTKKKLETIDQELKVHTIEPVGYFQMMGLLDHCSLVMTDSGGLQKESYFFGKPCVTLREETEWTELVDNGVNELTGSNEEKIIKGVEKMKTIKVNMVNELYGGGKASYRILEAIRNLKTD